MVVDSSDNCRVHYCMFSDDLLYEVPVQQGFEIEQFLTKYFL